MDPRDGKIVPIALLEEMIGVIADLYPAHPCLPKAQAILDVAKADQEHQDWRDAKLRLITDMNICDLKDTPENTVINEPLFSPPSDAFPYMGKKQTAQDLINVGRAVELPGTIEVPHSEPVSQKEIEENLTPAEKWHRCISAKLYRSDNHMKRAVQYYEMDKHAIRGKLNSPTVVPNPLFTLKSLYWVFESSDGYWEDVWFNCFGVRPC